MTNVVKHGRILLDIGSALAGIGDTFTDHTIVVANVVEGGVEVVDDGWVRSANWLNWSKDVGVISGGVQRAGMPADLVGPVRICPGSNIVRPWALPFDLLWGAAAPG
jgi:hypothetical protein